MYDIKVIPSLNHIFLIVWTVASLTYSCYLILSLHVLLSLTKAYELSTLTGTQVLLLVASETGHVYTFATRKLQPMITSETGKALIQTCLNSPDSPPRTDPSMDQRMSATGFEETDLTYQVSESESMGDTKVRIKNMEKSYIVELLGGQDKSKKTLSISVSWEDYSEAAAVNLQNWYSKLLLNFVPVPTACFPCIQEQCSQVKVFVTHWLSAL